MQTISELERGKGTFLSIFHMGRKRGQILMSEKGALATHYAKLRPEVDSRSGSISSEREGRNHADPSNAILYRGGRALARERI